jgi:hypothetical protein
MAKKAETKPIEDQRPIEEPTAAIDADPVTGEATYPSDPFDSGEFPGPTDEAPTGEFVFSTDFNAEEEYKVPPLVPSGKYEGNITNVYFSSVDNALAWDVTLVADPDILMSDNETPVNGNTLTKKVWFPKEGDELLRTKTGRMTKRQAKINMIKEFQERMRINMNTPDAIIDAVENSEWIGIPVIVTIEVRSYEGRFSNQVNDMVAG